MRFGIQILDCFATEFVECLKLLIRDERMRAIMGRNGREYVRQNYRWDVVIGKYERLFAKIKNARSTAAS